MWLRYYFDRWLVFTRLFKGELPNDAASNLPFGSPDVVEMSSRPVHACILYFRHVPPNLSSLSFEPHSSRHQKAINTIAHLFSQWQEIDHSKFDQSVVQCKDRCRSALLFHAKKRSIAPPQAGQGGSQSDQLGFPWLSSIADIWHFTRIY